jgi:VIT1/CCC1 family predicted Fe2+/Mn2+ transporter
MNSKLTLQTDSQQAQSQHSNGSPSLSIVYGTIEQNESHHSVDDSSAGPPDDDHLGKHRQYWRDIILGVNDGLVSTFLLVAGVAGGGLSSIDILLTAIAGAIAGAVSMFAGEYVATKSQNEVLRGEIALERKHIRHRQRDELSEVKELLNVIGISDEETHLQNGLMLFYEGHPNAMLKLMIALEFGVIEEELRSPLWAGVTSCVCFIAGSLPSVIPFAFNASSSEGLIYATSFTITSLLIVGAVKTWATRGNCWTAAMENLVIAGCGGGIAYGVGLLFDWIVRK